MIENTVDVEKKELLDEDDEPKQPLTRQEKWEKFKESAKDNTLTVIKFVKGVKFFTTDTAGFE